MYVGTADSCNSSVFNQVCFQTQSILPNLILQSSLSKLWTKLKDGAGGICVNCQTHPPRSAAFRHSFLKQQHLWNDCEGIHALNWLSMNPEADMKRKYQSFRVPAKLLKYNVIYKINVIPWAYSERVRGQASVIYRPLKWGSSNLRKISLLPLVFILNEWVGGGWLEMLFLTVLALFERVRVASERM